MKIFDDIIKNTRVDELFGSRSLRSKLIGTSWVVHHPHESHENIIFRKDNSLLVSINGSLVSGTWETLEDVQSLIIRFNQKNTLYKFAYSDRHVISFNFGGSNHDERFYLINEGNISLSVAKEYIKRLDYYLDHHKSIDSIDKLSNDYNILILKDGKKLLYEDLDRKFDGEYLINDNKFYLKDGYLVDKKVKYQYGDISIWQSNKLPQIGDIVINSQKPTYEINIKPEIFNYLLDSDEDGKIRAIEVKKLNTERTERRKKQNRNVFLIIIIYIIIFLVTIISIY